MRSTAACTEDNLHCPFHRQQLESGARGSQQSRGSSTQASDRRLAPRCPCRTCDLGQVLQHVPQVTSCITCRKSSPLSKHRSHYREPCRPDRLDAVHCVVTNTPTMATPLFRSLMAAPLRQPLKPFSLTSLLPQRSFSTTPIQSATLNQVLRVRLPPSLPPRPLSVN